MPTGRLNLFAVAQLGSTGSGEKMGRLESDGALRDWLLEVQDHCYGCDDA